MPQEKEGDSAGESRGLLAVIKGVSGISEEGGAGKGVEEKDETSHGVGAAGKVGGLIPQFDRLLLLAAIISFASLYLPWLPGVYSAVPGWKVPYATPDMPLDAIRHLEDVERPGSLFLLSLVGVTAIVFCRTSRLAGVRDLLASVVLVAGGVYVLTYFAKEWGWCLSYGYVGPYAAFTSLALLVVSGLSRTKFMPWVSKRRVLLMLSGAFLITGWFLPWSLDHAGVELLWASRQFYWLGSLRKYAVLMVIFPVLGGVSFAVAFTDSRRAPRVIRRWWALLFGIATLVYFHVMWSPYLSGFELGSWGTLVGLVMLGSAGILRLFPGKPFLARVVLWAFLAANAVVWLSLLTGGRLREIVTEFFTVPPPFGF